MNDKGSPRSRTENLGNAESRTIFIANRPLVFWANDPDARNLHYAKDFDTAFFTKQAECIAASKSLQEKGRSERAIRQLYCHASEATLALLFAILQGAPFPQGWLTKYRTNDLRALINCVTERTPIPILLQPTPCMPGWRGIAAHFLQLGLVSKTPEHEEYIKKHSTMLWRIATDFASEFTANDYNSIKHGLRGKTAPVHIEFTPHSGEGGKPDKSKSFELRAEHASHFPIPIKLGTGNLANHYQMQYQCTSWDPQQLLHRIAFLESWNNILKCAAMSLAGADSMTVELPSVDNISEPKRIGCLINQYTFSDSMRLPHPEDVRTIDGSICKQFMWPDSENHEALEEVKSL